MVEVIRARLGALEIALALRQVQSVLTLEEASGLTLIDLPAWLGVPDARQAHVGLLATTFGVPLGIALGEVRGVARWDAADVGALAPWLCADLPAFLHPGVGISEAGEAIWLINPSPWMSGALAASERG